MNIRLDLIQPSPQPVRTSWDEDKMSELIESIRERGVIAPIKVRPINGRYEIVYGHRRFEACRRLAMAEIPVIVGELETDDALIEQIIENELREDLPYLEKAQAYERALVRKGWTNRELAKRTGITHTTVNTAIQWLESLRLGAAIEVEPSVQFPGVAATVEIKRALGDDIPARRAVAAKVSQEELGQRDARKVADAYKAAEDEHERQAILDTPYRDPNFQRLVQAKTNIRRETIRQQERRQQEENRKVAIYLDAVRVFRLAAQEAIVDAQYGNFSPEAARFVKVQHDKLRDELKNLETILEVNDATVS